MALADLSSSQAIEETEQLLKRQHLERVFAATLPFKQKDVSSKLVERAINQTQKRWAWFMESRELDTERGTELGTLGYLPWEIRRGILKEVFDGYFRIHENCGLAPRTLYYLCPNRLTEPAPDIFNLYDSYRELVSQGHRKCYISSISRELSSLRLSSATLRFEYDDLFLSSTIFKFESPTSLNEFLNQLTDNHQTKLRRIIINIWVPCDCRPHSLRRDWRDGWKTACFQLPASLRQVSFELDYSRPWSQPWSHNFRSCFQHGDSRQPNEIKAVADLVEVLSKMIVRSAPDAVIEMHESARRKLLPEQLGLFEAVLNDIER